MKKPSDAEIVEYLKKKVMPGYLPHYNTTYLRDWNPFNSLVDAWMMHGPLRDGKVENFSFYITLADDGGMYYRANVHHEYDFMIVSSCVDKESPARAITMAVYDAVSHFDGKKPILKENKFWQMYRKPETPKIGVGVLLRRQGKFLLGLRKGSHGSGEWSLPGGHMELGEDFAEVCAREVKEETGITITGVKKLGFTNDVFEKEGLHYVTLFFEALWDETQEAENKEPDKNVKWEWFKQEDLPSDLFKPLIRFLTGC